MIQEKPEELIAFSVPLTAPSVNHLYKPIKYKGKDGFLHSGRKLSGEAKAFKDAVTIFARGRTVAPADPKERKLARYRVKIHTVLGPGARMDCDNAAKLCCDALQWCGVIDSDAKVIDCGLTIDRADRENERTEFIVERIP